MSHSRCWHLQLVRNSFTHILYLYMCCRCAIPALCTCMCYRLIQYIIKSQLCSTGRQSGLQIVRSGFESHDFSPNKKVLNLVALSPPPRYSWVGMGTLYNAPTRPRMLLMTLEGHTGTLLTPSYRDSVWEFLGMDMQIGEVKICTWVNKNHEKEL